MDHDGESGEVGVVDREAREALEPVVVPEELFVCVVLSSLEVWSLVLVVSPVVQPGLWPGNGSVPAR